MAKRSAAKDVAAVVGTIVALLAWLLPRSAAPAAIAPPSTPAVVTTGPVDAVSPPEAPPSEIPGQPDSTPVFFSYSSSAVKAGSSAGIIAVNRLDVTLPESSMTGAMVGVQSAAKWMTPWITVRC